MRAPHGASADRTSFPGGLLRKCNIKQRLDKCGGVVCHAPWGGQPEFPSGEIQAPLGYETTGYGCHIALAVDDGSSGRPMVEHIAVVIALLDIPHLEETRSRSHFGKRMIAGDVAATRNFSEPALC